MTDDIPEGKEREWAAAREKEMFLNRIRGHDRLTANQVRVLFRVLACEQVLYLTRLAYDLGDEELAEWFNDVLRRVPGAETDDRLPEEAED